jgi:predicted RNA binding protein YcfA (HicA-like mRNA interferase family)
MELSRISLAPRNVNHVLRPGKLRAVGRQPKDLSMTASSSMKKVRRSLERKGFTATKTRGGHWRFEHPDMDGPVFAPDTPSDRRGVRNLMATLRRKRRVGKNP